MATTTNRYLAYPAAAAGISRASSGSTAWSYSAYTQIVPANAITSTFYLAGLTWCWHTPIAAADTTYQWIIELRLARQEQKLQRFKYHVVLEPIPPLAMCHRTL